MHKDDSEIVDIIKIMSKGKRNINENDKQIKEMRDFMAKLTHPMEDRIEHYKLKNITKNHNFGKNVCHIFHF